MKRTIVVGMFAATITVGCLPTQHPVYTEKDLIFDLALLGSWQQERSTATFDFRSAGQNEYSLTYTDPEGHTDKFTARLAEVGGVRFLDVMPAKDALASSEFYKFHLVPIRTVYLVQRTGPSLQLVGFDLKWLDQYLAENPDRLDSQIYNDHRLITATTEELQAFLLEHQDRFNAGIKLAHHGNEPD